MVSIPRRVFLDTCVVNFILDFEKQIHDGMPIPPKVGKREARDIEALANLWLVGQRAAWQLAISPHTYFEIMCTQTEGRRSELNHWFQELWQYWRSAIHADDNLPSFIEAEDHRVSTLGCGYLETLPGLGDRVLLCDAIIYRCDLFCTRDWSTILKHRSDIAALPIEIVTPTEWWSRVQPHAALFC